MCAGRSPVELVAGPKGRRRGSLEMGPRIEMSQAGMAPSLVVRLARNHWHFEAVHPFSDGNGRVGRMLMTLQMVCEGYAPLYLSG